MEYDATCRYDIYSQNREHASQVWLEAKESGTMNKFEVVVQALYMFIFITIASQHQCYDDSTFFAL